MRAAISREVHAVLGPEEEESRLARMLHQHP